MRHIAFAVGCLAATLAGAASGDQRPQFARGIEFAAVDPRDQVEYRLGSDLIVRAHRQVDAHGVHMGWWLEALDRRIVGSPNFLYECLCGHGPHPTDLLAWHLLDPAAVANIGPPSERILPVWGYPYSLRVRCLGCEAKGDDATSAHFTAGTIEITWRRLAQSNARQKRLSDFR